MNGIIGFAELLNEQNVEDEKIRQFTSIILKSSEQLLKVIDNIIEISKLETGHYKTFEHALCLNELLSGLQQIFSIPAKEKGIAVYLKKSLTDVESTILTDETKLHKVLANLIENAVKFTKSGYIEIGYNLNKNIIELFVKDTGIGIPSEEHEIIFNRFMQVNSKMSENFGGLGLGLSIVKENTELLGGTVSINSEIDKGSVFTISIPYKPSHPDVTKPSVN